MSSSESLLIAGALLLGICLPVVAASLPNSYSLFFFSLVAFAVVAIGALGFIAFYAKTRRAY
ncbi:hypothetical protein [Halorussus sp. AFM4]|uniref:hypothetical protein n=1 Tax=Halorussus sp. AFM4 TaxID=3421651 RepID=UPI003EC0C789